MATWTVLQNNRPAEYKEGEHTYWADWANATFETLEDAVKYAKHWCFPYLEGRSFLDLVMTLHNSVPYDFNGYGDTITIVFKE